MDKTTPVADLFKYAKDELVNVTQSAEFRVKDLFKGYVWAHFSLHKQKMPLGLTFFNEHRNLGLTIANPEKSKKGQERYKKA